MPVTFDGHLRLLFEVSFLVQNAFLLKYRYVYVTLLSKHVVHMSKYDPSIVWKVHEIFRNAFCKMIDFVVMATQDIQN